MAARRPGGTPTKAEQALWRLATRDVEPLPGNTRQSEASPPTLPPTVATTPTPPAGEPVAARGSPGIPVTVTPTPIQLPALTYARAPGLDRRSSERLKRGHLPIEARLDLHGMTQDQARHALDRFIAGAYRRGLRAVLIITGKGLKPAGFRADPYASPPGILREQTPRWLNEAPNRARVLAFTPAQPRDGGSGALYVLLRRQRE